MASAATSADHSIRAARKEALAWTIAWTGVQLAIIVILAAGAWRVDQGLLEVEADERPAVRAVPGDGPVLALHGVTAAYGPRADPAVRDVPARRPAACHLAIVGSSGAGKTALLLLILRFLAPQGGGSSSTGSPRGSPSSTSTLTRSSAASSRRCGSTRAARPRRRATERR